MAVPYTFANATSAIPLSQLDNNFATPVTIGNVAIQLGNTVSAIGNVTLNSATLNNSTAANVTITSVSTPITAAQGGTGLSSYTANAVVYAPTTSTLATGSSLVWTGTNLGIGTSSPNSKLTVTGGQARILSSTAFAANPLDSGSYSGAIIVNTNDGSGDLSGIGMYVNSSYGAGCGIFAKQTSSTTADLTFFTGSGVGASNVERARIDSSGSLLVGTTTSGGWQGNARGEFYSTGGGGFGGTGGVALSVYQSGSSVVAQNIRVNATSTALIQFQYNGATTVGTVTTNGTVTVYGTTSDYRLKENVVPMTGALAAVAQLKPVTYKWKSNGSEGQGFIAHELQAVVPDCVTGEKDAIDEDGNPKYQGIDTSFLVATLTAAIQELNTTITSLTERITALESR